VRTQIIHDHIATSLTRDDHPKVSNQNWFALVVRPRHEKAAEQILANKGFQTFLPLYGRCHRYGTRLREYRVPLFPGYLFCRFDPQAQLALLTTPSVVQVVGAGRIPLPVDETEVESLRIAVASPFTLAPHPYVQVGRTVRVTDGPLAGAEGIIATLKDSTRLVLSITMLQRSVTVEYDATHVSTE
jgi:transcription termination/antitermination protein NusG